MSDYWVQLEEEMRVLNENIHASKVKKLITHLIHAVYSHASYNSDENMEDVCRTKEELYQELGLSDDHT